MLAVAWQSDLATLAMAGPRIGASHLRWVIRAGVLSTQLPCPEQARGSVKICRQPEESGYNPTQQHGFPNVAVPIGLIFGQNLQATGQDVPMVRTIFGQHLRTFTGKAQSMCSLLFV